MSGDPDMSAIDLNLLRSWIGRKQSGEDLISARHARLMAATVGYAAPESFAEGAELPPLWHWTYFLEGAPNVELGVDGHPLRGGFMPPVPLPNRMWAGGRVFFISPVIIGETLRKTSSILSVDHKVGRTGELVFVTVQHELATLSGELLIREEQDIVYKGPVSGRGAGQPAAAPVSQCSATYTPTSTMLFRYSALTFNGHRIHYDVDYCRNVEDYQNLVVHGPLNATMLAGHAVKAGGRGLLEFSYRGLAPALLGDTITLHADMCESKMELQAVLGNGTVCMQAAATLG